MFYLAEVYGCEPYVGILMDDIVDGDGEAMAFDTEEQAVAYAEENCAWEWEVVEF
jgi:hypothetical protein